MQNQNLRGMSKEKCALSILAFSNNILFPNECFLPRYIHEIESKTNYLFLINIDTDISLFLQIQCRVDKIKMEDLPLRFL
jgi:hypothetical protein